ncbi:MAG: hypothetical protein ACK42C_05440, partial [Aquificaceae bacterium]
WTNIVDSATGQVLASRSTDCNQYINWQPVWTNDGSKQIDVSISASHCCHGCDYVFMRVGYDMLTKRYYRCGTCDNGSFTPDWSLCIASAVCPDGGTLNTYSDLCEKPLNKACPDGWLEGATSCVSEPQSVCQGGGTSSYPKGSYSGKQYCVVKYINSQNRREYDTRECNPNCPVNAGEELVEPCKEKPMSGFTVATEVLSVIREALRDKICGR